MTRIEKKVWPEYFELIQNGKKKVELRLADSEVHEGDELILKEWDPKTRKYTGREVTTTVSYVIKTKGQKFWTPEEVETYGYQIIQFERK